MVAIVLGALNAVVISFLPATATILGSEAGTTIKLILAATGSTLAGKRLAYANFLYNAITILLALIFLKPINAFITDYLKISDVLVALVFFQTCLNVAGALLFFPFIEFVSSWLEKRFQRSPQGSLENQGCRNRLLRALRSRWQGLPDRRNSLRRKAQ